MILGIDYGTTRTVVAAADRGNYPVVSFHAEDGSAEEWYPSLIAARGGEFRFGLDAAAVQNQPEWSILPSFKRQLAERGPESLVSLAGGSATALDLLARFLARLKDDLLARSNLMAREPLQAMISVPANANSNQRFNTIEAFRVAGFSVVGMINEPSAAGIEYAHRYLGQAISPEQPRRGPRRENVIVYDLGGGTFDASAITMAERRHEVIGSAGISRLGGDDFDAILLDLAIAGAGVREVPGHWRPRLLAECREKKEGLHPNARKVVIDLDRGIEGAGEAIVPTALFYEQCKPLVERTIVETGRVIDGLGRRPGLGLSSISAIYLVGGSSDLPIVARLLRERYGRLVRKSPYPHAATAIGLAIAADARAGYMLAERFTRHFGLWREADNGSQVSFDVLFPKDTPLSADLTCSRSYRPAHNIGRFRYLECSRLDSSGQPGGDITPWDEISFPFDPSLQNLSDLRQVQVARCEVGDQQIQEVYRCDQYGIIKVNIASRTTGYQRSYRLNGADQ